MTRPRRPCSHLPGDHDDPARCTRLTDHPSGLCTPHLAAQRARTDANRPSFHRRGYDSNHDQATAAAKARGQTCQHNGCHRTDVHRDHIDGNPANNHPTNIQWLCARHHGAKTLTNDVTRAPDGRILPKPNRRQHPERTTRLGSTPT